MYPSGHRGVGAIVMLLVLVLGAMALLPTLAEASSNEIVGLVSQCGSPTTYLGGAQVTLTDVSGVLAPVTVTTPLDGTFSFARPSATYSLSATRTGYYATVPTAPFRFDDSVTITQDLCMNKQNPSGLPARVVTLTVQNTAAQRIAGATVGVYNITTGFQFVTTVVTNATGNANITVWQGTFQLRTTAPWYSPSNDTLPVTGTTFTVTMFQQDQVIGHAKDATRLTFISTGLSAFLYDPSRSTADPNRLIAANINGSLYDFHAPPGSYTMIVDANNYASSIASITVPVASNPVDVVLSTAPKERFDTTVLYRPTDWNNLTVYRNITLNRDSTLPGLGPAGLRDLRLQIDATLGNGDGALNAAEATAFQSWFLAKGPQYVTTDTFLLTYGVAYNSSATSFAVTVANLQGTGSVWINTSATYGIKTTSWIRYGAARYYVNVTALPDSNTTQYHDEIYHVQLPRAYEMVSSTLFPPVTVANYTRVTIDPGVPTSPSQTPQVKMIVQKSVNGTARAKVTGPTGKFFVVNSTYTNYQAYVASDTAIQFSAADSTDPVGDVTKANFTWRFEANISMTQFIGYGIGPTFTYATPGEYIVNLTVVQAGGNVTYRDIKVWVDGTPPVGNFKTNVTGARSATELAAANYTLKINQDTSVRFDGGSLSTDQAYPGKAGLIQNSGWAWDFTGDRITDATGKIAIWSFNKPGSFIVNLTVTDAVGLKGANVSLKVQVNDTQGPTPNFDILDPENDYSIVSSSGLIEGRNYTFNASKTTDNYNKNSDLDFTWTIPGPIFGETGTSHTRTGVNITFAWSEWNNSYALKLSVKDKGFGSGIPNYGNLTRNITVQVDTSIHPDLKIATGSLKVDNANPEEGQTITVSVNVTDEVNRATASAVKGTVYEISSDGKSTVVSASPTWSTASHTIASGSTVTLTFSVTLVGQGNKTVKVCVQDDREPYTWVNSLNCASQSVVVRQAGWVNFAILGSVVGVIAVFVFFMYYRRKVKSGEWQPRRVRREKAEGEEKRPRKEKEVKEEKKRL